MDKVRQTKVERPRERQKEREGVGTPKKKKNGSFLTS